MVCFVIALIATFIVFSNVRVRGIEGRSVACFRKFVRVRRIELLSQPWEGHVLPLNDTRMYHKFYKLGKLSALGEHLIVLPLNYTRKRGVRPEGLSLGLIRVQRIYQRRTRE